MFKHRWNAKYIENKYGASGAHAWAKAKKAELETKHHVPFDFYYAKNDYVFSVSPNFRNIQSVDAPSYEKELLSHLDKFGKSFIQLKGSWSWDTLFAVAKRLLETGQANITVNRNGKACGLTRRNA